MPAPRTLYLIRHGRAAERGEKWPDDAVRPLTHDGAVRMRQVVRGLAEAGATITVVITSPLVRALATAEIVVQGTTPRPELVTSATLAPGGSPPRVAEMLGQSGKARGLAIVGHEPDLGELAAWLIGARHPVTFKKGGVCRIDVAEWPPAPRQGRLVWCATPRMLRALGSRGGR
jgi:phosphohistidine phosphatase